MKIVYTHPQGETPVSSEPILRAGGILSSLLTEQHEILHYSFNTTTTLGNSIALLAQLSKVNDPDISGVAKQIATNWNNSISLNVEGVICYVSYIRAQRRSSNLESIYSVEKKLNSSYATEWKRIRNIYDHLHVPDYFKDVIPMLVADSCLNIPLYKEIFYLDNLSKTSRLITTNIINKRFSVCEELLFSSKGKQFVRELLKIDDELVARNASGLEFSMIEGKLFGDFIKNNSEGFEIFSKKLVRQSTKLAKSWNLQLKRLNIIEEAIISIKKIGNDIDFQALTEKSCHVLPPAPQIHPLHFSDNYHNICSYHQGFCSENTIMVCFIYEHKKDKKFIFSRKYNRKIEKGDYYIRLHFWLEKDGEMLQIENSFFLTGNKENISNQLSEINNIDRLIVIEADGTTGYLEKFSGGTSKYLINVNWGKKMDHIIESISKVKNDIEVIEFLPVASDETQYLVFRRFGEEQFFVYPVSVSAMEYIHKYILENIPNYAYIYHSIPLNYRNIIIYTLSKIAF